MLDREIDVSRGDVLAAAPLPALAEHIEARVVWMDETSLFRGRAYQVMLGTQSVVGTITDITSRLDIETLEEIPVRELHMNEIGRVALSLSQPVACEAYSDSRELGGFILIDRLTRNTVGCRHGDRAARRAGERLLAPARRGQGGAGGAERAEAVGAVVHRAVWRGQVHHRQPGGEAAARRRAATP